MSAVTNDYDLDHLGSMFEVRYDEAWRLRSYGKYEEAENKALGLLLEPRLGRIHRATVQLYSEVLQQSAHTSSQRAELESLLADANIILEKARSDQNAINLEVNKKLADGMTMKQLHDAQIQAMHNRVQAEADAASEDETSTHAMDESMPDVEIEARTAAQSRQIRSSQNIPDLTAASQPSTIPESQRIHLKELDVDIEDDSQSLPGLFTVNEFAENTAKDTAKDTKKS